ncbi:alpha-hydroxy acid oxidase [Herbaspirillum sp. YR522]|uniref:alpha-hydroxy acid oxidase n=1 Tax=Herbaspirillum sp. YR522 TaxID=1144342 RepID=UPI00026F5C08|nr:alpha-hydroxy acid oxidase [Herbaspirillum sp. YR522]EJN10204.1 alpha-hydroxyacid dehydrogenase, FMN-dependent L-lactate dehydrogenase [Herbaspirillum sp. YR522]
MTNKALQRFLSLHDFEKAAKALLPAPLYAYVSGAVEDEESIGANRSAFRNYAFRPNVLVDVSQVDTSMTLFGVKYSTPVGVAPMGIAAMTSYRGDIALALAARRAGAMCIMSGSSLIGLEEVMAAAPGTWFQAYLPGQQQQIDALIQRVQHAGVEVLVLTVDTPVAANRENNLRAGFSTPLRPSVALAWQGVTHPRWLWGTFAKTLLRHGMPHFENNYATRGAPIVSSNVLRDFSDRGHLDWEHVARVRKMWKGPLVIKGILNVADLARAKNIGADAIIVSNHGGRQLDGSVAPLLVLPEMIEAAGDFPVMIDSGIRRGTDVLKAMALGARAAWIGRPFNYAATVGGEAGVSHALELIKQEIKRDMGLLGVASVAAIARHHLCSSR